MCRKLEKRRDGRDRYKTSLTVDAMGLYCPMPIVKLKVGLHEIKINDVIRILADDPEFEEDVKQWCLTTGNTLLSLEKDNGVITAFIKKTV